MSTGELQCLVDIVLLDPNFKTTGLMEFNANHEKHHLGTHKQQGVHTGKVMACGSLTSTSTYPRSSTSFLQKLALHHAQ